MPKMDEKDYAELRRNLWILRKNVDSLDSDFTEIHHYVQRRIRGVYRAVSGLEKVEEIRQIPELRDVKSAEDRFFGILPFGWLESSRLAYRDIRTGLQLVVNKAAEISARELPVKDPSKKEVLVGVLMSYRKEREEILRHENDFKLPDVWYKVLLPHQTEVKRLLETMGDIDSYLRYEDSFMDAEELFLPVKGYDTSYDVNNSFKEMRQKYKLTGSLGRIDSLQATIQEGYGIDDIEIGIFPKVKKRRGASKAVHGHELKAENDSKALGSKKDEPFTKTVYTKTRPEIQEMEDDLFKDLPKPKSPAPSEYHAKFTKMDIDSIDNLVGEISLHLVQAISASKEQGGLLEIRGPGWEFEDLYTELRDLLISSQYSHNEKNLRILSEVNEVLENLPKYRSDPSILFDPMRVSLYHIRMATNRYRRQFDRKLEMERMRKDASNTTAS
jgi:hypothetical protein